MKKLNSMLLADAIFNVLQTRDIDGSDSMFVENFANGREQGLTIVNTAKLLNNKLSFKVSFSEARNSDQIVIRTNATDFGTEKFVNTVEEAVNFIQEQLS